MSKMTVECASVFVFIHQLANVSQIAPELFRSHRSVIPPFPFRGSTGSKGSRARPGLSYLPHLPGLALRVQPGARGLADIFQAIDELQDEWMDRGQRSIDGSPRDCARSPERRLAEHA